MALTLSGAEFKSNRPRRYLSMLPLLSPFSLPSL